MSDLCRLGTGVGMGRHSGEVCVQIAWGRAFVKGIAGNKLGEQKGSRC